MYYYDVSSFFKHWHTWLQQTQTEVESYQKGNDATSLGARFSMWSVGIQNGLAHPLGQSVEDREVWTQQYVKNGHPHLASAELYQGCIYIMSLLKNILCKGIPGLVILFFFYISIIVYALKSRNSSLLTTMLLLLLYGLTWMSILLSSEALIFFVTVFAGTPFARPDIMMPASRALFFLYW